MSACVHRIVQPVEQLALPFLLPLPEAATGASGTHLRKTAAWALQADAATWLVSELPADQLARALAARQDAVLPQDLRASLRFADARVLPVLHAVLRKEQAADFFRVAQAWWYVDRTAALQSLHLLTPTGPDRIAAQDFAPLVLDQDQETALLQAAEVDAVIALLVQHDARAAALDRPQRFAFVAEQIQAARQWNVVVAMDQALFCMAALQLGAGFDRTPAWQAALEEVLQGRSTMAQALAGAS